MEKYGHYQNIGSPKKFFLYDVEHFQIWKTKLIQAYFGEKIKMYGPDQNIVSLEKFCLSEVDHFGGLFSKMDRPSQ